MFLTIYAPQRGTQHAEFRSIDAIAAVDSLYFAFQPLKSLALGESFLVDTNDAELRWRAARAAIALGMLADAPGERTLLYDRALVHARQAVALRPASTDARYWLAAAAGRRAHKDDPVNSARLAVEVYDLVSAILAEDSLHAGAHHALGMLHAEVTRVPALARFIASRVLRLDVASRASVRDAERHLKRAVELEPSSVTYLADLSAFLIRSRRLAEADSVMRQLMSAPARHPTDERVRSEVQRVRRAFGYPASARSRHLHAMEAATSP